MEPPQFYAPLSGPGVHDVALLSEELGDTVHLVWPHLRDPVTAVVHLVQGLVHLAVVST